MSRQHPSMHPSPASDSELGGLSEAERHLVYSRARLTPSQIANAELMVRHSGQRDVGEGALDNVRTQLYSKKNRKPRTLESHTCERLFAYVLELDPSVQCYYVQPPCYHIVRTRAPGQRHVSRATLDFLVFYEDRITLVECKYLSALEELSQSNAEWRRTEQGWTHIVYEQWAMENGIAFRIWHPPHPMGVYLQNMEAIYALWNVELNEAEQRAVKRAVHAIEHASLSIEELCATIPNFRERLALWLIAHHQAYGLIQSTSMDSPHLFLLYSDQEQADYADRRYLEATAENLSQPKLSDPVLLATTNDFRAGQRRLARIQDMECGRIPWTIRLKALSADVKRAVARGETPLSACLTHYAASGNRLPRLLPEQYEAMDYVVTTLWNKNRALNLTALKHELRTECERRGVPTPSISALSKVVKQQDPALRALAYGGIRAYQAIQTPSSPSVRSLPALGYGHTLHVDSSNLDSRCAPHLVTLLPAEKPIFYIGVDASTRMPMAHAFIFGPANTDGVAILIREYVYRHGFLPCVIFLDRGPENISLWLKMFCAMNGITLSHSPSAGSRFNGLAEFTIKQVNTQVAQAFPGSTARDAMGRKVDGKFKSRKADKTAFLTIVKAFEAFVYGDLSATPRDDNATPHDLKEDLVARYGVLGTPQPMDDNFIIKTSIPIVIKKRASGRDGIRTADGYFTSTELQAQLRTQTIEEVRADCVDPSVIYVKVASAWLRAFSNRIQHIARLSPIEKLFERLIAPITRRTNRAEKEQLGYARHLRQKELAANMAHPHLKPATLTAVDNQNASLDIPQGAPDWDDIALLPEE